MEEHRDEQIHCADCGASFVFSADEAAVFAQRGLTAPKRCKDCRRARKERGGAPGAQRHGAGNGWDGGGRGAPRYTGDVNEYRSPMQDGFSHARSPAILAGSTTGSARPWRGSPSAGEFRGSRSAGEFRGSPSAGEFRGSPSAGEFRGSPSAGEFRSPSALRGGNFHGEYRSPMQDRSPARAHAPREDGNVRPAGARPRGPFGAAPRDGAPPRGKGRGPRPPVPRDAGPNEEAAAAPGAKPARKRAPAAMFAITCNACGAQAEVPFQPAEGREVFCPTCYRARRTPS
jgi:CxxC-x17-CxxC domain-containing protein